MSYLIQPRDVVLIRKAPPNNLKSKDTSASKGSKSDNLFILNIVSNLFNASTNPGNSEQIFKIDSIFPVKFRPNQYDIYLNNFTTYKSKLGTDQNKMCFVIYFDGMFSIRSNSTNNDYCNKLLIPNETINETVVVVHKGNQMNYICSKLGHELNQFKTITITITDLNKGNLFANDGSRYTMELIFVERN